MKIARDVRVEALLRIAQEDYFSAEAAYEAAISLAPERAPLRLWFAGFLSRFLGDQDRAVSELLMAEKLAPGSAFIKLECARVLQYQRRFEEAGARLNSIEGIDKLSSRTRRVHLDLCLQNDLRGGLNIFLVSRHFLRHWNALRLRRTP